MRDARALVATACSLLLLEACAPGSEVRSEEARNAAPVSSARQSPLQVFPKGFDATGSPMALINGGTVELGRGLSAEVFMDPYPASGSTSWFDLYLLREDRPLADAEVRVELEMAYMSHGVSKPLPQTSADGHYLFVLEHPMVGLWRNRITIQQAGRQDELSLVMTVLP
jgi:hypothetical protein